METLSGQVLEVGIAALVCDGESESGDQHLVAPFANGKGTLLAAVDGLGHGKYAARAASLAVETMRSHPEEPPLRLLQLCHEGLRGTRGAVVSIASFDHHRGSMCWLGVGDVWGGLFLTNPLVSPRWKFLLLRSGVVGVGLPTALHSAVVSVRPGDTLLLATDGIRGGSIPDLSRSLPAQRLAEDVLARYKTGADDALVLVARVAGAHP